MNMKDHILAAMREQFNRWIGLLTDMEAEQIITPLTPSEWSIKDVIVHLWAWQQRSIARVEAARLGREPDFPQWLPGVDPDSEASVDQMNAWIYQSYREQPWSVVHQNWVDGYLQLLRSSQEILEKDLLDAGRYTWLGGLPLVFILLASYDHHQEHFEKLDAWLVEHGA